MLNVSKEHGTLLSNVYMHTGCAEWILAKMTHVVKIVGGWRITEQSQHLVDGHPF